MRSVRSHAFLAFLFFIHFSMAQVSPVSSSSMELTGTNFVSVPDNNLLDMNTNTTFEGWYNLCSDGIIFSKNYCNYEAGYYLVVDPSGAVRLGSREANVCNSGFAINSTTLGIYSFNEWHHFALTVSVSSGNTQFQLFMDHNPVAAINQTVGWVTNNNTEPLRIGAYRNLSGAVGLLPKGRIQEFRVYNSILPFNQQCMSTPAVNPFLRLQMQSGTTNVVTNTGTLAPALTGSNLNTNFNAANANYLPSTPNLGDANLSYSANSCGNQIALSTDPFAFTYTWLVQTPGNPSWTTISNTTVPSENYIASGTGTYTFIVSGAIGSCMSSDTVSIPMNNQLGVSTLVQNESCLNACNGSITTTVSGGVAPYIYSWSNSAATPNISNLCPGNYSVQVTDQNGCIGNAQVTIAPGIPIPDPTIQTTGPFSAVGGPVQFTANSSGGTWSSDCGACISASGVFNPQTAGDGTFQICYTTGSGVCTDQDCQTIIVNGCIQTTSESYSLCPGDSYLFNGQTFTDAGTYPFVFTGQNGCDSIHTLNLSVFTVNATSQLLSPCEGDSILVEGNWYLESDNIVNPIADVNGCLTTHTYQIVFKNCSIEDYAVDIPNIFTPNGDNINDFFSISIMGGYLVEGFIVNRWGNIINQFYADNLKWDGRTSEGNIVEDGVYTYVFIVSDNYGHKTRYQGFVTVLR